MLWGVVVALWVGTQEVYGGCVPRDFGHGSVVCVCDAGGCDALQPIVPRARGEAVLVTSSKAGRRWHVQYTAFREVTEDVGPGVLAVEVDDTQLYQTIVGFGGAFTDAASLNILSLPEQLQEHLLRSYFSPDGLEYGLGRVPIGGTDFSTRPYTYNDLKPGHTDAPLDLFALAPEDINYKIPLVQRALAMSAKPLKLFASAWSAPAWMKTNDKLWGKGKLKPHLYRTWANYHVKFLQSYLQHNISFWAMTAQNEPSDGLIADFDFNAMGWTAEEQGVWVGRHLGPALTNASLDVKVLVLDDNRLFLPRWMDQVWAVEEARQYVYGVGLHWYLDFVTPASLLDVTHTRYPNALLLYTEACTGQWPWQPLKVVLGSWVRAEDYAANIIDNLQHWVGGWVDWNLALDVKGGPNWAKNFVDSPIIVNAARHEFYKQPMFYALAHFTKALPEGTRRIKLSTKDPAKDPNDPTVDPSSDPLQLPVYRAAFVQPDGTFVLIIVNRYHDEVEVRVRDPTLGEAVAAIEPHSFVTIAWRR